MSEKIILMAYKSFRSRVDATIEIKWKPYGVNLLLYVYLLLFIFFKLRLILLIRIQKNIPNFASAPGTHTHTYIYIYKIVAGIWLQIQKEDGANTSSLWSHQRNCRSFIEHHAL